MNVDVERALKVGRNYLDVFFDEAGTPCKYKCRECHKLLQQDVSRGYQTLKVSQSRMPYSETVKGARRW